MNKKNNNTQPSVKLVIFTFVISLICIFTTSCKKASTTTNSKNNNIESETQEEVVLDGIGFNAVENNQDLNGTWLQLNTVNEDEFIQFLYIENSTIKIYKVNKQAQDLKIWWSGTFDTSFDITKEAEIVSLGTIMTDNIDQNINNKNKLIFSYKENKISYIEKNIDTEKNVDIKRKVEFAKIEENIFGKGFTK